MVGVLVLNMAANFFIIFKIGLRGIYLLMKKLFKLSVHNFKKFLSPKYNNFKVKNERKMKIFSAKVSAFTKKLNQFFEPI
jgi:hypothetical protein